MNVPIPASIDLAPLENIAPQLRRAAAARIDRGTSPVVLSVAGVAAAATGLVAIRFVPKPWLGLGLGVGLVGLGAWQLARLFGRGVSVRHVRTPGELS